MANLVRVNPKQRYIIFIYYDGIITYHLKQEADRVFNGEIEVDESHLIGKR